MSVLIAIVSGFASGVFLRSIFSFGWEPVAFVGLLAALFGGALLFAESRRVYSLAAVFLLCVALGMMRAAVADTPLPEAFARDVKHRVSYQGVVASDPDVRDANQRVEVRVTQGGESTTMLAVAPRYPSVAVGDSVYVSGTLLVPQPFADDNGRIFRYDKYLQRDGVRFILNFAYLRVVREAPWYSLPALLARIKHSFLDGLAATLPEPYASLAGGIVIGGKSGLGADLQNAFVRSGLVQIIVLSGYNVMVVAEWVMAALACLPAGRRSRPKLWNALAGALAIVLFVGVAGASATALRAALMALIALYARATGRSYTAGRALLVVVLLMLVWNPLYLAFDPGFGLSVAATAGLIWLAPIIESRLAALRLRGVRQVQRSETLRAGAVPRASSFWRNTLATTLAAQIFVLPLLLYDTGNLSLVAIPANALVIPLVPLAMGLSAFAGLAGILFGSFAPLVGIMLAFPAYIANAYLVLVAQRSAALSFAAFIIPAFPFWLVLAAYAALMLASKRFSTTLQLRFAKKASM